MGQDRLEEASPTTETGQPLAYSHTYAIKLGQYLLNEGILVCLLQYGNDQTNSGSGLESSSTERMRAIDTTFHAAPEQSQQVPFGVAFRPHTPQSPSTSNSSQSSTSLQEEVGTVRSRKFQNSNQCLYRFVDMEDRESGFVFHSMQVLPAALSSRPLRSHRNHSQWNERQQRGSEMSEFDRARLATQVVIAGVLQQRARLDRTAKAFLARPHVVQVLERAELNSQDFYKLLRI